MRRLLTTFAVSLAGLTCALLAVPVGSAHAGGGRHFHTVMTFRHSRAQMCRASGNMFWYQIDNTQSHRSARLRYREVDHGVDAGDGPIPHVAPGVVSKNVGGTVSEPGTTVTHIRLWHGGMLKRGTVALSSVKPC